MADDDGCLRRYAWEQRLRGDPDVTGVRLLVLLTLATYMDADGTRARPGQRRLGQDTGLAERTVRDHLAAGVTGRWLVQVSRGHRRGDGSTSASEYATSLPEHPRRLSDPQTCGQPDVNRQDHAGTGSLNRQLDASQPAGGAFSTGTGVPPTRTKTRDRPEPAPVDGTATSPLIPPETLQVASSGLGMLRSVLRPEDGAA